jgi:hypothetical protein
VKFAELELSMVLEELMARGVAGAVLGMDCKSTVLEVQNWRN